MHDPREAADNRLAIERAAERLARQREQLEEQALAEAQRREQAAAAPDDGGSPPMPNPSWRVAAAIVVALGLLLAGVATWQRSSVPSAATLRLDTDAEGFARRAAQADFQESSRRLVNPSAIQ